LLGLADFLRSQGKLSEAEPLLREAMEGSRGVMSMDRVAILRTQASVLKTQGKLEASEPLYREALEIQFKVRPAGHDGIADSLASEGAILKTLGKTKEANEIWERIGRTHLQDLTNKRNVEGDTVALARSVTLVGSFLQSVGRFDEAEVQYRDALAIRQKLLGPGSREVATIHSRIADLLVLQGKDLDEAEAHYRETLSIRRKLLGEGSPEVAGSLRMLSDFLQSHGRNADAQALWRETVELRRATAGSDSALLTQALKELAIVSRSDGKPGGAEKQAPTTTSVKE
jgi:tetratricopeptide (TPR) repeat protein